MAEIHVSENTLYQQLNVDILSLMSSYSLNKRKKTHFAICSIVNADDRESNMVFNSKSNEVEDDDDNEVSLEAVGKSDSDSSDGASGSKPNQDFFSTINWQEKGERAEKKEDSFDDSDDEFGNLRNGEQNAAAKSTWQAHDFFSEKEGEGSGAHDEDMDLFHLKSPSSDEINENLFNLDDSDSDVDEPVISKQANNVDLLNLGSNNHAELSEERPRVEDDMGVDLLNLSTGELASG